MEHDFCKLTGICRRCYMTKVEAQVYDPPASCDQYAVNTAVMLTRRDKLRLAGLLDDEPKPAIVEA